jgi:hypothetical protein
LGRELRARGRLPRVWFQASIESAAVAGDVTRAARGRACAGLRLAWQRAVTLLARRVGFLQSALWSVRSGWKIVRPTVWWRIAQDLLALAHALSELGTQADMGYRALVRRRLPRGLAQLVTGTAIASRFTALNRVALRRPPWALRTRWATFRGRGMSRPLLALNLFMAGFSVYFSIRVGHALFTPDLQSPPRIARPFVVTAPRNPDSATSANVGALWRSDHRRHPPGVPSGSRHEANLGLQDRGQTGWRTGGTDRVGSSGDHAGRRSLRGYAAPTKGAAATLSRWSRRASAAAGIV